MDPQPRLVRTGTGRFVPTLIGDPGPVPPRRRGPYESDDKPEIAFLEWIFGGMNISTHGRYARIKAMTAEERIAWMRRYMPKTYALLANNRGWDEIFA